MGIIAHIYDQPGKIKGYHIISLASYNWTLEEQAGEGFNTFIH